MRGPGDIARIRTEDGRSFMVEQRTETRGRSGARKSVATVYEYGGGRNKVQTVDSSLRDLDVAVESAKEVIEFHTGSEVETVKKDY